MLKIIAGIDKSYQGEVVFSPGYSVGYLEQDPQLDPQKTVIEVVREGVQPVMDMLAEFDRVNEAFGDPDVLEDPDKMDALIARQAELQDRLDAADAWNIDSNSSGPWTPAVSAGRSAGDHTLWRRASPCGLVPPVASATRRASAR